MTEADRLFRAKVTQTSEVIIMGTGHRWSQLTGLKDLQAIRVRDKALIRELGEALRLQEGWATKNVTMPDEQIIVSQLRLGVVNQVAETKAKAPLNFSIKGWGIVLACLPFAVIFQGALLPLAREAEAMFRAALGVDGIILLRSLVGLRRQPESRDWRFYCGALFAIMPLIHLIGSFAS